MASSSATPTQGALAREVRHEPTPLIAVLDTLGDEGLVARHSDPADRRSNVVAISDRGRQWHAAAQAEIRAMEDERLAGVSPRDRRTQHELLRRLADG